MLRSSLLVASAAILCSAASAQQTLQAKPVPGAARDAGTYHVATQTWTRSGGQANISPDYIYRNDAGSGYFGVGFESCKFVDEIILPGTGNPNGGLQDAYSVDGFEFLYCKNGAGSVDWKFCFYDSYVPCDDPCSPASCINQLSSVFTVTGLPGGSACWIVTLDLAGGYELCMEADGGVCAPGYDGGGLGLDGAGIGAEWTTSDGGTTGPFLNGDPNWKPAGDGTCYTPTFGNVCGATDATGLGGQDLFGLCNDSGGCALGAGCYFFGGYVNTNGCGAASQTPFASFGYGLFADCTVTCTPGGGGDFVTYCDETQNPNNVADLSVNGTSLSTAGGIVVTMSGAASGPSGYLLVSAANGIIDNPPGAKGSLCLIGSGIGRYVKDIASISGGMISTNLETNLTTGSSYNIPGGAGGGNYTTGSTWYFQYWHRQPMGAPSTFSEAGCLTFG